MHTRLRHGSSRTELTRTTTHGTTRGSLSTHSTRVTRLRTEVTTTSGTRRVTLTTTTTRSRHRLSTTHDRTRHTLASCHTGIRRGFSTTGTRSRRRTRNLHTRLHRRRLVTGVGLSRTITTTRQRHSRTHTGLADRLTIHSSHRRRTGTTRRLRLTRTGHTDSSLVHCGSRRVRHLGSVGIHLSAGVINRSLRRRYRARFGHLHVATFPGTCFRGSGSTSRNAGKSFVFHRHSTDNGRIVSVVFRVGGRGSRATAGRGGRSFFGGLSRSHHRGNYRCTILYALLRPRDRLCGTKVISIDCHCRGVCIVHPRFFVPVVALLHGTTVNSLHCGRRLTRCGRRGVSIAGFRTGVRGFGGSFNHGCRVTDHGFRATVSRVSGAVDRLRGAGRTLLSSRGGLHLTGGGTSSLAVHGLA